MEIESVESLTVITKDEQHVSFPRSGLDKFRIPGEHGAQKICPGASKSGWENCN
jgi:hypothetical protein